MQGKVEISGLNTSKLKLLTEAEKRTLLERTKSGDKAAREALIQGNIRLVLSVIQRFMGRGECADDLFQVGCIGLIKAIDNFDITLGVRFSTYAVPMIIGEVRRYLRDYGPLRVSRSLRDTAIRAMQVKERLQNETGNEPTISSVAKELDLNTHDVVFALESIVDPISLYEPIYNDRNEPACVMDQIGDEQAGEESWICNLSFREAVEELPERERRILTERYLLGKTQIEVAQSIGISQAQVSRLEKNALRTIREQL